MNDKILVELRDNWADEFDINAIWLTNKDEYNKFINKLSKLNIANYREIYFGTNECISFSSAEEIIRALKVTPITDAFFNEFTSILGNEYGLISISSLLEYYSDEEE